MQKIKRLLAFILIIAIIVTQLPVAVLASDTAYTAVNMQRFSNSTSSFSKFQYALSLKIELKEIESSLSVQADTYSLGSDAPGGELVVTLYENKNGIPKLIDLFTAEVPSGILEDTPDTPEASGILSFAGVNPENLVISGVICRSLDEMLPLSASVSYDVNGFIFVPVFLSTLEATEITKTSAVLHGQVAVEVGTELNAADFGFLVLNSLESEVEEEIDEDGYPVGVILPDALPAASITTDGRFSLPLTNLKTGQEYQYMAVKIGNIAVYGEAMAVTTKSDLPVVETNDSPTIDSGNSIATLKGTITDTKGFAINESGMMFGTDPNSDPAQKLPNQSELEGTITSYYGTLQPGETYYFRAYAKNSAGIGYGKTHNFTMPAVLPEIKKWPSVTFDPVTWKASFSAEIQDSGGAEITERGFRYQYKNDTEWYYLPVEPLSDSNTFTLELEGQRQLPVGYYKVEAYLTNSEGMATMLASGGGLISTPYLSEVDASLDNASVTVSSATLKGNITAIDYQGCQGRGFEYKATSDNLWLEVGIETGNFGMGEYNFTLEGLKPYTKYLFRAKAFTYAGWSYSPEISFTTIFSDNAKETAYQMKMDGKSATEIAGLLNKNLGKTIQETIDSLKFVSFNASDIAGALKVAPYEATYREAAAALKLSGFDASDVAGALKTKYADIFAYEGGDIDKKVINVLIEQDYTVDEMVKALRDFFKINIVYIKSNFPSSLGVTTETVYTSLISLYGAYAFANDYWREYNAISNPSWYIGKLTEILKNNTSFSAGDIAAVLKEVYPQITAVQFIINCRELYPAVSDMGDAVIQALGADPLTAAMEMKKYSNVYSINDIKTWLIHKHGLDAPQMVKIMMGLTDPVTTVPSLLKDDFGITSATDAARVMYDADWKEDESGTYGYWRVLKLLKDHFSSTGSDLINIMKELGFTPLTVAQQMEALKIGTHISSWIPEYKAQGYTASDLAGWCKTTSYGTQADQTVIVLRRDAGYSLDEITAALKQVYELDANGALTILKYSTFINTYSWWTEAQATAAVDLAYDVNTLEIVIEQMKNNDATAVQIANTLKETFLAMEPNDVSQYLIELGYEKNDVLQALAQSFRTMKNAELIQMLAQVLRDKFSEQPIDNMKLILSLYESVKGSLNHGVNGVILLHNSGFTLPEITRVLKNDIDALQNVPAKFTALEAGQLLLGLKAYGVSYDKLDVFAAVEDVYDVNFMLATVIDFKNNNQYSPQTIIEKLSEEFGIDAPSAAALCLKAANYSLAEVLEGLAQKYASEKDIYKIKLLIQVIEDVYPEEQAPVKAVMEAMNKTNSGLASETLYRAGYSMKEIINVLQKDYKLSSGEITELLYDRNFENIVVSVEDVYGGNGYLDFILYRKGQGDSITKLFDWLNIKLGVTDIAQIVNTLKFAGFPSEDVITLLFEKRKVSKVQTILEIQEVFGTGSITNFLVHRKSRGDNISQVFYWLSKFGVTDVQEIINYLAQVGYSSTELIEFLFKLSAQNQIEFDVETVFGENTIVTYLKDKKTSGDNISEIYILLKNNFAITNITQIANYLKAVNYTSFEIMDKLFYEYRTEPGLFGEIISAVQAANAANGTDAILGFLSKKKEDGEGLTQLYDWLKDKFNITDMAQAVAYLKAVGYTNNEIIAFWLERHGGECDEEIQAIQAASDTDVVLDFLREMKTQGENIYLLYGRLNDKFGISDINKVSSYFLALGYNGSEIIEFLYQHINDPSRYEEIIAAVQAAQSSTGSDAILEFMKHKKNNDSWKILNLYNWLNDKFGISDINKVSSYFLALGYSGSEIIEFLYQQINDSSRYEEIISAVQAANAANGTDAILGFLSKKKEDGEGLTQLYDWLKDKFNITDMAQAVAYLKAVGYTNNEIIAFWLERHGGECDEEIQAIQAASDTDVVLDFLREMKTQGENIYLLYGRLNDKFGISDINKVSSYFLALGYSGSEIIEFLYQQINDSSRYEEIIAAVQAANAANGTDAILGFLSKKKEDGEGLTQLYDWLKDKFNITDMAQAVAYLKAVGYTNNEIIAFWLERHGGECDEEIQAIQAASDTDVVLDFLREMKTQGENIYLLYGRLNDKFGISDINKVSSYFLALGYNGSEIIEFLYQHINDPSRYEEIIAAVQAAQSYTGSDAILEFMKHKKNNDSWKILNLYNWLNDKFGISDINKVSSYFLALGYNGSEIIEFLYQHINDPSRYEEIIAAVQAAQSYTGSDAILEFMKHKKNNDSWKILNLYNWLNDKFGISDINKVSSYFLALGYSGSEIIEFLYQQINDSSRYEEIIAAVQAAQSSTGSDAILEFMKHKKNNDSWDILILYNWIKDKFGISGVSQVLYYLKETGFSSQEVIKFVYGSGYKSIKEQLISSVQNNYSDDSIIELLEERKSQGDGLLELYNLLSQLDITETGQVTAYFQRVGFTSDQVAAFLNERGISRHNQIISLIQNIYGGDAVEDFLKSKKNEGYSAGVCITLLTDKFGITDTASVARYLKKAGYTDYDIIDAIDYLGKGRRGFATLKALYSTETAKQLAARLLATSASNYYSFHDLVCQLKQEFPALAYSEIVLMLRDGGKDLKTILNWLMLVNDKEGSKAYYLELTKDEKNDLASILGREDPNDLNLDGRYAGYILHDLGFSLEEATKWAIKGKFSNYDVFVVLKSYRIGISPPGYRKELLAMENAGFSLTELAEAIIAYLREGKDNESWNPYLRENPYQTSYHGMMELAGLNKSIPEVVEALIEAGISPRYMINSLNSYWYSRYYLKDGMPNHYPHTSEEFSLLNIVTWIYNGVENLPEEKSAAINMVEEAAAGLYSIRGRMKAEDEDLFNAMMFVAGKMSHQWNKKLPAADVYFIDDIINTINSLISFPQSAVNNVLDRILVVNAMRTAGLDNDEATALLKSVVGTNYIMNFAMQAMGGYNAIDSWDAVMRVDAYRNLVGMNILWFIACNAYRLDAYYKVIKDVKKNYDRIKKVCMFLINHDILKTAPVNMAFASYGGLNEIMSLELTTISEISDVTLASGENSTITVRGTVSSGADTELLLLMKKPDVSGSSQKDAQLASLTDQELKGMIDYFGCVSSTEFVEYDGEPHNFELRYSSDGISGEYAAFIGTADAVETYTTESILFAKTLGGNLSITGTAKSGETLTADISGIINGVGTLTYQWYRADYLIDGANSNTYTLVTEDIGKTITIKVIADGIYAIGSLISAATEEVIGAYTVIIDSTITGGTITASPTTAIAGETITLTITPDTGKQLKVGSLKYNDGTEDHTISGISFTMPEANVTVTAEFELIPPTAYAVSIDDTITGGTITASPTTAIAGETIMLTITPNTGKQLKAGSLKYNDGTEDHAISGIRFIMPETNVTVTAEFELIPPTAYAVSIDDTITGGTITASPTTAIAGETIMLTITPNTGKQLKAGSLKYNDGTEDHAISGISFTMPEANVTVTAEFELIPPTTYTVSIDGDITGGTITASPTTAVAGETITLTITPDTGKQLKVGSLKYNDGTEDHSISGISFTMPEANVTVTAEFEPIPPTTYTVSIDDTITGGTITASPTTAIAGETITLTITPDIGKQLKAGSLKYNDGTEDHAIIGTSFTMPETNVTVTAEFEPIPPTTYTVIIDGDITGGTITASPTTAIAGETITLTITPNTGKQLKAGSLKYNDGTEDHAIIGTSFIMPETNVMVTAEFEPIPPTTYTVSIDGAITGGTITASPTTALAGETITLIITPNTGKQLKVGSLKYNDGMQDHVISGTSFTMPEANVMVTAEFEPIPPTTYTVSIDGDITGGTITASPTTAIAGETITLTITPDTGKQLKVGSLKYNDGTEDHAIIGTSFIMPETNVMVTAEFEPIPPTTYTVSIDGAITGGTITASPTTAIAGETITLTITPDTGKQLKAGSLKYNDGTEDHAISGISFTMPETNVTVTAEFEAIPPTTYTVIIDGDITGGTITASPTTAIAGETITLTITPNTGKQLKAGSLKYNDGTEDHAIIGTSFIMPETNVMVTAEFEPIPPTTYTVSIDGAITGGTITASPTTALAGETITLIITPNTGKQLKVGSLKYNDGMQDHVISGTSFTMPEANVTVTAEFELIPPTTYTVSIDDTITGGTITASPTTAIAGETIMLTITPNTGKQLKAGSLKYNDGTEDHAISGISFTMPEANVMVTAEFELIPPTAYAVSIDDTITGGTITASPTTAIAGETITLTITPDTGKQLKVGSLKYNDGTEDHAISGISFTMPEANVTVTAEFELIPPTAYAVSIDDTITGGTITPSPTTAIAGEIITLTITPNTGKQLKAGSLKYNDGTEDHAISGIRFIMPETNVTVTAEFEAIPLIIYTVSIGTIFGGSITASSITAVAGETISLTITPDTGKRLKMGSLKYNDGTEDHAISGIRFIMPETNVMVTAEFDDVSTPVTDHDKVMADIVSLSIGYAPGDSSAAVIQNVNLTDTGAVYGSIITWTSSNTAVISNSGVVIRPKFASGDAAVTLTATVYINGASSTKDFDLVVMKLPQITYIVTFDKNGGDTEASPATKKVISGGNVGTLPMAPTRSGYTFNGWNTQANGSAFTATTVVNSSITVYAQWSKNSSGGGGDLSGGSGGTSTPIVTPKTETIVEGNTATATTTVTATVDSSGNVVATVSRAQLSDAISKAMKEAEKQGEGTVTRVEINVETSTNATSAETIIPKEAVSQALEAGISALMVSSPVASITFDSNTLSALSEEATGDMRITASKVETSSLLPDAQRTVGNRPVFDFSVTIGNKIISQFEGDVSISVPYNLKEGEDINAIVIYYINESGELEVVSNCIYEPSTGRISFSTRHFSQYAVGYNKINFKDVSENAWYSKAVGFIAAREITTGTGGGNFSPEGKLTRGQFVVMLMRAYGIVPNAGPKDNFADAGDTYYTGYLATAKRLSISNGVGNNMFAPNKEITRQEMFTLLYNVLKVIGRLPKGTDGKQLSSFADAGNVASWAKEAMTLLVKTGIISGNGGKLSPTSTTTRVEMAQVLYNLLSR